MSYKMLYTLFIFIIRKLSNSVQKIINFYYVVLNYLCYVYVKTVENDGNCIILY